MTEESTAPIGSTLDTLTHAPPAPQPGVAAIIERAEQASREQDWIAAAALWKDVIRLSPTARPAPERAADALRHTARFAAADAILAAAMVLYPDDLDLEVARAWVAHSAEDWDAAEARWQSVCRRHPDNVTGFICAGLSLRSAGRRQAAEAFLEAAMARFPENYDAASHFAWTAQLAGDWDQARTRWQTVINRFADRPEAHSSAVGCLRDAGAADEADRMLQQALARFPNDPDLAIQSAWRAMDRRDWTDALARWAALRERCPKRMEGYAFGARTLREKGCLDAAERVAVEGCRRFPSTPEVWIEHAWIAHHRRDWVEARRRWDTLLLRYPGDTRVRDAIGDLTLQMAQETGAIPDTALSENPLLLNFESLGDNCEFGLVQRRFGVEPLGLLRWANIDPKRLLAALQSRFEGVGLAENTRLTVNSHGEYIVHDSRFFEMHTFYAEAQISTDALLAIICRRLTFLREELLRDLAEGEKIFVYKRVLNEVTIDAVRAIADAIRAYGNSQLLWVQQETPAHKAGNVLRLDDNLLTGFVERLPALPNIQETPHSTWLRVCQEAIRR